MHILYIHQYFCTDRMPGGTRSFDFAKRLVEYGHTVTVITTWREAPVGKGWFLTDEDGVHVHWLNLPYQNRYNYLRRCISFFKFAFYSTFRACLLKPDLIYATSTPLTVAIPGVIASKWHRVPMIFEVRDLWPELPVAMGALKNRLLISAAKLLEGIAYKNSELVITLSPGMAKGVACAGYPVDRISVLPNTCLSDFDNVKCNEITKWKAYRNLNQHHRVILYAGTFGKINGVGYLVDIAEKLADSDPSIIIFLFGDGAERESIKQNAIDRGVYNKNLFIESPLSKFEIKYAYAAANLVCSLFIDVPEMQNNSANKFFDGLAAGKPMLINYGGWQMDLLEQNCCGFCTWRMSIEDSANLIKAKLNDELWLESASKRSSMIGKSIFNIDKIASRLNELAKLAVERRGYDAKNHSYDK